LKGNHCAVVNPFSHTEHVKLQVQIDFTSTDGVRCRKVLDSDLPACKPHGNLQDLDVAVMGTVAIQRAARLALLGHRKDARELLLATHHKLNSLLEGTQKV
jgi:hypothetical protein